jgi:pyruvate/2-oxoglutarate dehydrogenase complex dihydrolipoamide dehydrogenase (E3) component
MREDPDASELLLRRLEAEGVNVLTGAQARVAVRSERVVRLWADVEGEGTRHPIDCDAILIAAGRVPNVEDLGLEAAGVAFTKDGVTVNAYLQTSQKHIYAAGDVAGPLHFTHVADAHARTIVRNILFPWRPVAREDAVIPWCTYTTPEVARVGLNETEAAAKRAGDLVHEFALAMKAKVGLKEISGTIHAYPTYAEIARKVADRQQKARLTPFAKRVFSALYRLSRRG